MRGFPYAVREEAPVWVSHGVWRNIPDLDAPTQLVLGSRPYVDYYRGVVPKGVLFPVCGMNLAFRREALPLAYWCPCKRLPGAERFDDIWMGIHMKRGLDAAGAALVTGFAECIHTRLSDTFANLRQEAVGIGLNERYWQGEDGDPFFVEYDAMRRRWAERMMA
jgi:reversibly glycosylated polypeptide/UDP-arabinopyranose mutase